MRRLGVVIDDELFEKAKIKCIKNKKTFKEYITMLIQKDIGKEKE